MSSMVERVARALCKQECEYDGITYSVWDQSLSKADREKYREQARAAIEAMREPSDEMVSAAEEADEHATDANLNDGGPGRGLYSDGIWRAMITAALEDK